MNSYRLYLVFIVSHFLHIPARIPVLGAIHLDLILVLLITATLFGKRAKNETSLIEKNPVEKYLRVLVIYIVISLPFVEWPGSVIHNSEEFIKAIVFFYFTVSVIDTESKLKGLMTVFLGTQIFRVYEPLYLHITEGYWGSYASMANWEFLARLAGSPNDVINPNGLAFVIVTVIPLLHFLCLRNTTRMKFLYLASLPGLLYALILTSSRSGYVALFVVMIFIFLKTERKTFFIVMATVAGTGALSVMDANQLDRLHSIYQSDTKNSSTAEGRIDGIKSDFLVALSRPIVGHGLGTSAEANYNEAGKDQLSHNLYTQLLQELGLVGAIIFLLFLKNIFVNFYRISRADCREPDEGNYLSNLTDGMQVWLYMNLVFSLVSYGLSSYEWYFFGGLSVVIFKLAVKSENKTSAIPGRKRSSVGMNHDRAKKHRPLV